MDKITIQPADNYRDAIIHLLRQESLPTDDLPAKLEHFFVAIQADNVIGTAGLEQFNNYGLLRSLTVASAARSNGIAGKLLSFIEQYAITLNIKSLYLLTETASDYFKQRGFHSINRKNVPNAVQQSSEFSYVCPQSAIVMLKNI